MEVLQKNTGRTLSENGSALKSFQQLLFKRIIVQFSLNYSQSKSYAKHDPLI